MPEWLRDVILAAAPLLTYLGGKWLVDRAKARKLNAESVHITKTSEQTMLQMSESVAKDYIGLFKQATTELTTLRKELDEQREEHRLKEASSQRRWLLAESIMREWIHKMKTAKLEGWEECEMRFNKMVEDAK